MRKGKLEYPLYIGKVYQSDILGDPNKVATQVVTLDNGVVATIKVDNYRDLIEVVASNGEHYLAKLSDLREYAKSEEASLQLHPKPINKCRVATGVARIGHATLWGGALGGGPGLAAGAAVGAFWWLIGTQC